MSERVPAGGAFKAAAGMHESLNLEHLSDAKRLLYTYCPGEFCEAYLDRLTRTALLVARARIEDLSRDEKYAGVDRGIIDLSNRLVQVYAEYISGMLVTVGESVLVRAREPIPLGKTVAEPGETVPLPPAEAIGLVLAGLAEPVREIAIKLQVPDYPAGPEKGDNAG